MGGERGKGEGVKQELRERRGGGKASLGGAWGVGAGHGPPQ